MREIVEWSGGEGLHEVVGDKGYHSNQALIDLGAVGIRSYISEPDRARRNWTKKPEARAAVYRNRRRIRGSRGLRLLRQRGERLERSFAHLVARFGRPQRARECRVLGAIRQNDGAACDRELCELLHHILVANRFWLLNILRLPFVFEAESRPSSSFDELIQRYGRTHEQQSAWLAAATKTDLARVLESALIPGGKCSVAQALMQVCMHSHGHRAQCAKLLRRHGGVPPITDFIHWLETRPTAEWAVPLFSKSIVTP